MLSPVFSVFIYFFIFIAGRFFGRQLGVWGFFLLLSGMTCLSLVTLFLQCFRLLSNDVAVYAAEVDLFCWLKIKIFSVGCLLSFNVFVYLMMLMVTIVFLAVVLFSFYYMRTDPNLLRFFSYLSLFVGFMLLLVAAGNFLVFFVGWEGVGLSSFLLINFWTTRIQTSKSALKALLINRIGDFFLLIAVCLTFRLTYSFDFQTIFLIAPFLKSVIVFSFSFTYVDFISFALVMAAVSKSAQIGLHIWLPDAMEGPTPVSAMIHAATMVTAGLYLLLKCSPLLVLSPSMMNFIILIGAATVLSTSVLGAVQYDIKKIIAFSTCSQLGYMMTIIGSSYFSLAFFHLLTHAFFKALLFLAAGSIIHLMQGEQDIRRLAGAFTRRRKNVASFSFIQVAFLLGTLSITGLFFFSGYYSKELILYALAFSLTTKASFFVWLILNVCVFLTAYYSFRLFWLLFFAPQKAGYRFYHLNISATNNFYEIVALTPLIVLSVVAGLMLKGIVLYSFLLTSVLESATAVILVEFNSFAFKIAPFLFIVGGISLGALGQEKIAQLQQSNAALLYFTQSRYYYDNLLNKIALLSLKISTKVYLILDKGILEWIGPRGLIPSLYWLSLTTDYLFFDRRIETSYLCFMLGIIMLFFMLLLDSSISFLSLINLILWEQIPGYIK